MFANISISSIETLSSIWCIVFPTNPNSATGHRCVINRASDVPPVVDNSATFPVCALIALQSSSVNFPTSVAKGAAFDFHLISN